MYLIDGIFVRGIPATRADATDELDDAVRNSAKFWSVATNDLLVLKEVAIALSGVVQEMAYMVIPKSHVSGLCFPPYRSATNFEVLNQLGSTTGQRGARPKQRCGVGALETGAIPRSSKGGPSSQPPSPVCVPPSVHLPVTGGSDEDG